MAKILTLGSFLFAAQIMTKSVHFAPVVEFYFVSSLSQMTDEDIGVIWYSPEEEDEIQNGLIRDIKLMRSCNSVGRSNVDDSFCRGIEHMRSTATFELHRTNRTSVVEAVLKEQKRQKVSGSLDVEKFLEASAFHSCQSRDSALSKGASDAAFVDRIVRRQTIKQSKELFEKTQRVLYRALQGVEQDSDLSSERKPVGDCRA